MKTAWVWGLAIWVVAPLPAPDGPDATRAEPNSALSLVPASMRSAVAERGRDHLYASFDFRPYTTTLPA
jgi:hypothetical protein